MKYENAGDAAVVLPDGRQIARGESADVSAADARHPVVQGWIDSGVLRADKAGKAGDGDDKAATKAAAIKAAADKAKGST